MPVKRKPAEAVHVFSEDEEEEEGDDDEGEEEDDEQEDAGDDTKGMWRCPAAQRCVAYGSSAVALVVVLTSLPCTQGCQRTQACIAH